MSKDINVRHVGFSGSRDGMTEKQHSFVYQYVSVLNEAKSMILHHGDCVGADAEMHNIAKSLSCKVVIHPPVAQDLRANCEGDECLPPKTYFARNRDIVDTCDILIATPGHINRLIGGTWYTVNYAKKRGIQLCVVLPDGTIEE